MCSLLPPPPVARNARLGPSAHWGNQAKGWTLPEMMTHLCFSERFGVERGEITSSPLYRLVVRGTWSKRVF